MSTYTVVVAKVLYLAFFAFIAFSILGRIYRILMIARLVGLYTAQEHERSIRKQQKPDA